MKKSVIISATIIALVITTTLMFLAHQYQKMLVPNYQFTTEAGEVKRGWCKTNQPWSECKSEYNVWYKVKDYERIK